MNVLLLALSIAHAGATLTPYDGAPPVVPLTTEEQTRLAAGEAVKRQVRTADGGRGVAVVDVHAPVETVWDRILDFPAYPRMVDNVSLCEIYARRGDHIFVRFEIGALFMSIRYQIDHTLDRDAGWMTWTLDAAQENELAATVGFWRVEPVAGRPGWTRVAYSVEVVPSGWVPAPIEDYVTGRGLTKATAWVKRESEAAAGN
ncbi:MAG: SRPBCC family protein [Pseudomonadota bacterium]